MAQIAIKGHPSRDKEVIEILEMLGGQNNFNLIGDASDLYYYINNDNKITYTLCNINGDFKLFTVEEFLEKYPYKVGDVVMLKGDIVDGKRFTINHMFWNGENIKYDGAGVDNPRNFYSCSACRLLPYKKTTEDRHLNPKANRMDKEFKQEFQNIKEFFYDVRTEKDMKETMEETMEGVYAYNEINCYHQDFGDKVRIRLGNDFEIKVEEDITYIVKKQPQYPKTYDECVNMFNCSVETFNLATLKALRELIYCRNAYWKIAGEQMGLGKPWEPEYPSEHYIFTIENCGGNIIKNAITDRWRNRLLIFPTKEMSDMFYENFKEMIEVCKDFL